MKLHESMDEFKSLKVLTAEYTRMRRAVNRVYFFSELFEVEFF